MKAYVLTTGALFGAIAAAHLMRMVSERRFATEPFYLLLTAAPAILCVWAVRLYRQLPRR